MFRSIFGFDQSSEISTFDRSCHFVDLVELIYLPSQLYPNDSEKC